MAGRKKQLADNTDKLNFSLTQEAQSALQLILSRRKNLGHERCVNSQIVDDAIMQLAAKEAGITREMILSLIGVGATQPEKETNLKKFPKKD